jgi:hypothetical protein
VSDSLIDKLLLVIADIHGGHTLGLLAPGTVLWQQDSFDDEPVPWIPSLNPLQVKLWDWFRWDLDWVVKLAAGRPIIVKINGDITQGLKYVREWVSVRPSDQIEIAVRVLSVPLMMPNVQQMDFVTGTLSHEQDQASPILARRILQAETGKPIGLSNHYLTTINETTFDLAHHGPIPGSRRWLEGNSLRWYTNDLQQRELDLGNTPSHWVIRSHYHTFARSASDYRKGTTHYRTESLLTPGFTGMDGYARQATRSKFEVHVGMVAWEIPAKGVAGSESLKHKLHILDTRRREVIE